MNKLTYTNFADLKADFNKGVAFNVTANGVTLKVVKIVVHSALTADIHVAGMSNHYGCFKPDGSNSLDLTLRLVKAASSVPVPVATKSFLERFIAGEEFHTEHTRETVVDVKFERGLNRLTITLADETGKRRETPRYNVDGTHKFRSERNLKAGRLPPKEVDVKVTVYKHAYNGTLFVIREGEVIPNIRGISNATKVGETVIREKQ